MAALRFAIYFASQRGAAILIVHIYHIVRPTSWRQHRFENHHQIRKQFIADKLRLLLARMIPNQHEPNIEVVLKMGANPVLQLLEPITIKGCSCICIATKGRGKSDKIIGSTSSKLIVKSPIPVISVPNVYKTKKIEKILYASNLANYLKETKKIVDFVSPLAAEIKLLHIATQQSPKASTVQAKILRRLGVDIQVKCVKRDTETTLHENISLAVKKTKPDLVVLFIHRAKPYWNSMFHPNNISVGAFYNQKPILTFKK